MSFLPRAKGKVLAISARTYRYRSKYNNRSLHRTKEYRSISSVGIAGVPAGRAGELQTRARRTDNEVAVVAGGDWSFLRDLLYRLVDIYIGGIRVVKAKDSYSVMASLISDWKS